MPTNEPKREPRMRARLTMHQAKGPTEPHEDGGTIGVGVMVPATIVLFDNGLTIAGR